jgi:hypothetical protein
MADWTVSTYYKKSIEEHEHFTKDGMEIVRKTGWRSGSWNVTTSDDNPPEFEFDYVPGGDGSKDSVDINNFPGPNIEDVELIETFDGCWEDVDWPEDMDEEERERLEALIEEEGFYALEEEEGWMQSDTEMWLWGPILIEGENDFRKIIIADKDGNVTDFKDEDDEV